MLHWNTVRCAYITYSFFNRNVLIIYYTHMTIIVYIYEHRRYITVLLLIWCAINVNLMFFSKRQSIKIWNSIRKYRHGILLSTSFLFLMFFIIEHFALFYFQCIFVFVFFQVSINIIHSISFVMYFIIVDWNNHQMTHKNPGLICIISY